MGLALWAGATAAPVMAGDDDIAVPATQEDGTAGAQDVPATEWTDLLESPEFSRIVTVESKMLDWSAGSLNAQIRHLRHRIESYRYMARNMKWFPDHHIARALESILVLAEIADAASSIAQDGKDLDMFLRSDQAADPKFDQDILRYRKSAEGYTLWLTRWDRDMSAILEHVGWADGNTAGKDTSFGEITADFGSAQGRIQLLRNMHMAAIFMERRIGQLKDLTSEQTSAVSRAWHRDKSVSDMKAEPGPAIVPGGDPAMYRTLEQLTGMKRHRTLNETFGIRER